MVGTRGPADLTLRRLLERLTDVELAEQLRGECCDGPLWQLAMADVARAALRALHASVLDGDIGDRTLRLGRPVRLGPAEQRVLRTDRDERSAVASAAVVAGLGVFRDEAILQETWRPDLFSLRTCAVDACLGETSLAVRGWRLARPGPRPVPDVELTPPDPRHETVDVDRLPETLPDELRRAARIRLRTGRPWAAIAPQVGATARTLEYQLRRFRREHGRRNGGDLP